MPCVALTDDKAVGRLPLIAGLLALLVIGACAGPRDVDMLVWSKPDWNPKQEDLDYDSCRARAELAAERQYHWERTGLKSQLVHPTPRSRPAHELQDRLRRLDTEERRRVVNLTGLCMNEIGYVLVPINQAQR